MSVGMISKLPRDLTASTTGQRPELPKALQGGRCRTGWSGEVYWVMFVFKIWNCVIPISNSYFHLIGFFEYDQVLLHDTPDRNWSHYIYICIYIYIYTHLKLPPLSTHHCYRRHSNSEKSDVKPLDSIENRYLKAVQNQVTFPILACDVAAGDSHVAAVCWTGAV